MRVSILGAGSIGFGMAAFLAKAGHYPMLWSPSGERTRELAAGAPLRATKAIEGLFHPRVAATCADAVGSAEVVIIALPAYGHRAVIDAAAPHLRGDHTVVISSHTSFGALYLSKLLTARGVQVPIVVWGTTLVTGRQKSLTHVDVNTVRQKLDVATLPDMASGHGYDLCRHLFGDRFVQREGLLAIALSNLNPQNHLGIALCNLTRMERREAWSQGENVTPAVGRFIEALDLERLAVADAFGLQVRTVQEHFSLSFHVPMSSVSEMNQEMHRRGDGGFGPTTIETRYILEDVPFGLLPTTLLARIAGRPAILHEAGIAIFSAAYGRDLTTDNNLLPELGLERHTLASLEELTRSGWKA
jgi:opine dehydrogenase